MLSDPYVNMAVDLLKADTPHTTAKISRTYHQLEFKLTVEQQYKKATDAMLRLYQADGDKKILQDTKLKQMESNKKIQLLQVALKKYRSLHILDEDNEEGEFASYSPRKLLINSDFRIETPLEAGERKDNLRKPLTGTLHITVKEARDLEHAPVSLLRRNAKGGLETSIVIKVEGTSRAVSHPSRTDRWNESFEIPVDKANEVELGVYDKQLGEHPVPIGFFWVRISDVVEAQRKQKIAEAGGGGWVAAGAMPSGHPQSQQPNGDYMAPSSLAPGGGAPGGGSEGVGAWFAVEPVGAIALHLSFGALPKQHSIHFRYLTAFQSRKVLVNARLMPV